MTAAVVVVVVVVCEPGVDVDVAEGAAKPDIGGGNDLDLVSCRARSYVRRDEGIPAAHMEVCRPRSMASRDS